jgi:hypothetical protein
MDSDLGVGGGPAVGGGVAGVPPWSWVAGRCWAGLQEWSCGGDGEAEAGGRRKKKGGDPFQEYICA